MLFGDCCSSSFFESGILGSAPSSLKKELFFIDRFYLLLKKMYESISQSYKVECVWMDRWIHEEIHFFSVGVSEFGAFVCESDKF